MNTLRYALRSAFKSIWLEKWFNLIAIFAISIGLFILCAFVMLTVNMDSAIQRWSKSFGIIVYLSDGLSREEEEKAGDKFRQDPDISEVNYISKETALENVRTALGSNSLILDVFKGNPLPSSFELKIKSDLLEPAYVREKAAKIEKMNGIKEVQYGEKWLSSLNTATKIMKIFAIFFGGGIFVAITFITYSIIKIFFHRRRDDIETLKLLGAPRMFIRLPLLIEGMFMGSVGGALSSIALFIIYSLVYAKIAEYVPSIKLIITSMPIFLYVLVPVSGALMSLVGSYIAIGRIRY
ncbi:MAG: ABC transporter permease [Nitrospiraceae bacterium]|nr:MAG: ABC transporter permease [Nitrospiraceae bacterium]